VKSSLEIQHERWAADRWKVMLRVNGVAFAIGADCATLKEAQDLRTAFKTALFELGISMPNTESRSRADVAYAARWRR
jgi:hypothetical protein